MPSQKDLGRAFVTAFARLENPRALIATKPNTKTLDVFLWTADPHPTSPGVGLMQYYDDGSHALQTGQKCQIWGYLTQMVENPNWTNALTPPLTATCYAVAGDIKNINPLSDDTDIDQGPVVDILGTVTSITNTNDDKSFTIKADTYCSVLKSNNIDSNAHGVFHATCYFDTSKVRWKGNTPMPTNVGTFVSVVGILQQIIRQAETLAVNSYLVEIDDIKFAGMNTNWKTKTIKSEAANEPNKAVKYGHTSTPQTKRPLVAPVTPEKRKRGTD